MIIIEGADNCGKTMLGERLAKQLQVPLRHSEKPNPAWTTRECRDHSMRQLVPQRVILDRVYAMSETIYGPICRGQSALGDYAQEALLDLYHRPHLIIYCRPPLEVILKNNGREQMEGVLDNHKAIVEAYDRLYWDMLRFSKCLIIQYDWKDKTSFPDLLNRCQNHLGLYDQSTWSATAISGAV